MAIPRNMSALVAVLRRHRLRAGTRFVQPHPPHPRPIQELLLSVRRYGLSRLDAHETNLDGVSVFTLVLRRVRETRGSGSLSAGKACVLESKGVATPLEILPRRVDPPGMCRT